MINNSCDECPNYINLKKIADTKKKMIERQQFLIELLKHTQLKMSFGEN